MANDLEIKLRELVQHAWRLNHVELAIALEATAFCCLGINLNAEREAFLAEVDRRRSERSAAK